MKQIDLEVNNKLAEDLNKEIRQFALNYDKINLHGVCGQRYIGCGIDHDIKINIDGVPGNDLGAYMAGPELEVFSNAQDAIGNTMNKGRIIVHGSCGDTTGYAMRGGEIFVKDSVGYRVGIHMKEYLDMKPVIVIGSSAGDFLGEYLAGGIIILLGIGVTKAENLTGKYLGTGMHGGVMYINGSIPKKNMGKEIKKAELTDEDKKVLNKYIKQYKKYFNYTKAINIDNFSKYVAADKNPYHLLYTKN